MCLAQLKCIAGQGARTHQGEPAAQNSTRALARSSRRQRNMAETAAKKNRGKLAAKCGAVGEACSQKTASTGCVKDASTITAARKSIRTKACPSKLYSMQV